MKFSHLLEGLDPQHLVSNVVHMFHERGSHFLPVTVEGDLKGILRLKDLNANQDRLKNLPVKDLMLTPARTIDSSCSLQDAVEVMARDGVSCLMVTDNEKGVGVLCLDDVLRFFSVFF